MYINEKICFWTLNGYKSLTVDSKDKFGMFKNSIKAHFKYIVCIEQTGIK